MSESISHEGVVSEVSAGCVKVRVLQTSACSACKVAGYCNAAESKEKIIEVSNVDGVAAGYKVGDNVVVSTTKEVATKALTLCFGVPFLIMVIVAVIMSQVQESEAAAAVVCILSMAPYYFVLWLFRKRIGSGVRFKIENQK